MSRCIGLVDIQNLVGLKTTARGLSYELDVNGKNKNWNINFRAGEVSAS